MDYRLMSLLTACSSLWLNSVLGIQNPSPDVFSKPAEYKEPQLTPLPPPLPSSALTTLTPLTTPTPSSATNRTSSGCEFVGTHAIADWLNTINIGSLLDISSRYMMRNNECFIIFDPSENLNVWVEPYGFSGHYRSSKKVNLSLSSVGSGLGARYALFDNIHLGGGAGYFHSNFDSKGDHGSINGFYFGPSFEYLFSEGSIGFMIMGIRNFYEGERKIKPSENRCKGQGYNEHSWDLDLRLEGEYDIQVPSDVIEGLTIHPALRIDYLNVFEKGAHYKLAPQKTLDIKDHHSSFFYSKLSVRFEKMLYCTKSGFLAADFDAGWVNMTPLSSAAFKWKADSSEHGKHHNITPESKNQCALGIDLIGVHQIGILIGLGYQATLGANSPIQSGRIRLEWNW